MTKYAVHILAPHNSHWCLNYFTVLQIVAMLTDAEAFVKYTNFANISSDRGQKHHQATDLSVAGRTKGAGGCVLLQTTSTQQEV